MRGLNKKGLWVSVFISFLAFLISSCSEDSNFNKLFIGSAGEQSFNYLYSKAVASYDTGDIDSSLSYAEKAADINPDHVGLNILMGNIYLSKTQMSILNIIRIYLSNSGSSSDFNSFLIMFKDVLDLSEENILKFGEKSESNTDLFKKYPLFHPTKTLAEARTVDIPVMVNLAKVKEHICRYIDPLLNNDSCALSIDTSSLTKKQSRQAKLLWAFSHLVEAVALSTIIVYTLPKAQYENLPEEEAVNVRGKPVIELRTNALKNEEKFKDSESLKDNMDEYLTVVSELTSDVESVFNTDENSDSLFLGLLSDLDTTANALMAIVKNQESNNNYLKKMADKIRSLTTTSGESKEAINGDISDSQKSYLVLKNKLMDSANKKLKDQMDKLNEYKDKMDTPEGITTDQKNRLCEQYTKFTNSKDIPAICR